MDPIVISAYVDLAMKIEGIAEGLWNELRAKGVTDEEIAGYRSDYAQRIARREAEPASDQ